MPCSARSLQSPNYFNHTLSTFSVISHYLYWLSVSANFMQCLHKISWSCILILSKFWLLINDYSPNLKKKGIFQCGPKTLLYYTDLRQLQNRLNFLCVQGGKKYQLRKDMEPKKNFTGHILTKLLEIHPLHIKRFRRADHAVVSVQWTSQPPLAMMVLWVFLYSAPLMPILQKNEACHIKGRAHSADNWHGLFREREWDGGAVPHRVWLGFSVAGASPALGCYDTGQRQSSYETLWHKQLSSLQSTRNI